MAGGRKDFKLPASGQVIGRLARALGLWRAPPRSSERWFSGDVIKTETKKRELGSFSRALVEADLLVRVGIGGDGDRTAAVRALTDTLVSAADRWDNLVAAERTVNRADHGAVPTFILHGLLLALPPRVAAALVLCGFDVPEAGIPGWAAGRPGRFLKSVILKNTPGGPRRSSVAQIAKRFGKTRNTVDRWFNAAARPDLRDIVTRLVSDAPSRDILMSLLRWNYVLHELCCQALEVLTPKDLVDCGRIAVDDVRCAMNAYMKRPRDELHRIVLEGAIVPLDGKVLAEGFASAFSKIPPAVQLHMAAEAAYKRGDLDLAVECHQQGLKLAPGDGQEHYRTGFILAEQGKHEEALPFFSEAVRLDPRHEHARIDVAYSLLRLERSADAIAYLEEQYEELGRAGWQACYCAGLACMLEGQLPAALDFFVSALAERPENPFLLDYAAQCAFCLGRGSLGQKYAKRARELGVPTAHDTWKLSKYRKGQPPTIYLNL